MKSTISKNQEKFDEWLQKIIVKLEKKGKASEKSLPGDFRYLKYWAVKLKAQCDSEFDIVKRKYMEVSFRVGEKLYIDNLNYLKLAQSHEKGTKSRLIELLRFVYHYSNYTHDCFLEAGAKGQAAKNLMPFWDFYADDVFNSMNLLDDFQKRSLFMLVNQSKNVGIKVSDYWVLRLEEMMSPPDPYTLSKVKSQLREAEQNLSQEKTNVAIVLADQAFELLLKDLCLKLGCTEETICENGKPFFKWGFSEYMTFLSSKGEIDKPERATFFQFHGWRNSVQHSGVEPSVRSVRTMITEIKDFLEKHYENT